jgi:hypothetical protein
MKEKEREMRLAFLQPLEQDLDEDFEETGMFVPVALTRAVSNSKKGRATMFGQESTRIEDSEGSECSRGLRG